MTGATWAATAGAAITLLLCGGKQCHAFLASGRVVFAPQHLCRSSRCSGSRATTTSARFDMSTAVVESGATSSSNVGVASIPSNTTAAAGTQVQLKDRSTNNTAAEDAGRRWIKDLKAGDKVIGYVAGTTKFAAFVDCSVVRRGAKDKIVPVTGFLHVTDVKLPYALAGSPRAKDCEVEVKRGIHLTAYVKDVFPNTGRMTLSLDPNINKEKVLKLRHSKRERSRTNRRDRLRKKGPRHAVGDVVEGYVREVRDSMLLVDVMFAQLSVLRANKIRDSGEGGKFVNLAEKTKPGDVITVRIEAIDTSKRRGVEDDKATIDFVGWGRLGTAKENEIAEGDRFLSSTEGQQPFDIAAEIDALPASPELDLASLESETDESASLKAETCRGEEQVESQQRPPDEQAP